MQKNLQIIIDGALNLERQGNIAEAIDFCQNEISANPDPDIIQLLAGIYFRQKDYQNSLEMMEKAVSNSNNKLRKSEYLGNMGNIYLNMEDYDKAENCYIQAVNFNDKNYFALYNIGKSKELNNNYSEAIEYYLKAIEINHDFPEALTNLSYIYYKIDEFDKSLFFAHKAIELQPNNPNPYFNAALSLSVRASFKEKSLIYFQKAISLEPKIDYLTHYAITLAYIGEFSKAIQLCLNIIENDKNNQTAYKELFNFYFITHNIKEFDNYYEKYKSYLSDPVLKDIYIYKALSYYADNQPEETVKYLNLLNDMRDVKAEFWNEIFEKYLHHLINYRSDYKELYDFPGSYNNLYTIGESHALSPAFTTIKLNGQNYTILPKIIYGCTIWHLISDYKNSHKEIFNQKIEELPKGSKVIFTIGEIDTRANSGICKYYRSHPNIDLEKHIAEMANKYTSLIKDIAKKKKLEIYIQGTPTNNEDLPFSYEQTNLISINELQHKVIALLNKHLKEHCEKKKINFLDIYSLSNIDNKKDIFIDNYHLKPHYIKEFLK